MCAQYLESEFTEERITFGWGQRDWIDFFSCIMYGDEKVSLQRRSLWIFFFEFLQYYCKINHSKYITENI